MPEKIKLESIENLPAALKDFVVEVEDGGYEISVGSSKGIKTQLQSTIAERDAAMSKISELETKIKEFDLNSLPGGDDEDDNDKDSKSGVEAAKKAEAERLKKVFDARASELSTTIEELKEQNENLQQQFRRTSMRTKLTSAWTDLEDTVDDRGSMDDAYTLLLSHSTWDDAGNLVLVDRETRDPLYNGATGDPLSVSDWLNTMKKYRPRWFVDRASGSGSTLINGSAIDPKDPRAFESLSQEDFDRYTSK